ncbi:hypothetical protein ACFQPA_04895 [Halomarina halobia]
MFPELAGVAALAVAGGLALALVVLIARWCVGGSTEGSPNPSTDRTSERVVSVSVTALLDLAWIVPGISLLTVSALVLYRWVGR